MGEKRIETVAILGQELKIATDLDEELFARVVDTVKEIAEGIKKRFPDARGVEVMILTSLELAEKVVKREVEEAREKDHIDRRIQGVIQLLEKGLKQ